MLACERNTRRSWTERRCTCCFALWRHSETDLDVANSIITKQVSKEESDPGVNMAGVYVTPSPSFMKMCPGIEKEWNS